jgi:hypothetical protein
MGEARSYSVDGYESFSGTGAGDDDLLFTAPDVRAYGTFILMSSAGAVDVEVTLDGTNWSTAPLSLTDLGAEVLTPVLVTVAGRVYGFRGKFRGVRVRQNGGTAATACLTCGNNL